MKYIEYSNKLIYDIINEWSHGLPDSDLTPSELRSLIEKDLEEWLEWTEQEDTSRSPNTVWMSMGYLVDLVTREVWKRNKRYLEELYEDRKNIQKNQ